MKGQGWLFSAMLVVVSAVPAQADLTADASQPNRDPVTFDITAALQPGRPEIAGRARVDRRRGAS